MFALALATDVPQFLLAYDLWFYLAHRALHIPWIYKRYHYQHHAHLHPPWHHTFVAHVAENVVSGLGLLLPLAWKRSINALCVAWVVCLVRGVARHDVRCAWLVGAHHLHHHVSPGKNFSAFYIDWLFGTAL